MKVTTTDIMRLIDAEIQQADVNYDNPDLSGEYWAGRGDALRDLKDQIESGAVL